MARNRLARRIVTSSRSSYGPAVPSTATRTLDDIDLAAMREGSAMRRIPNWRKKPTENPTPHATLNDLAKAA